MYSEDYMIELTHEYFNTHQKEDIIIKSVFRRANLSPKEIVDFMLAISDYFNYIMDNNYEDSIK